MIVRKDLPLGVMAAQVAHAAGSQAPHPPEAHVVVLAVEGEAALRALAARLPGAHLVVESDPPYVDQAMAIGCPLVIDRTAIRKEVSSLPLLR